MAAMSPKNSKCDCPVLTPTTTITDCPQLDIICIPGGIGINALLTDETIIEFVKTQSNTARYITSVCTGALLLVFPVVDSPAKI